MTEKLREELARIGDTSPRVAVPADVWARGRRARRRDRVVVGAAVLSVVAMLGGLGLVLGLPGREDAPPVSGDDAGAVPSVIHGVPNRFSVSTERGSVWDRSVAESDLAIGRASVAFGAGQAFYLPVVVTAADGRYHPLDLPGWYADATGWFAHTGVPLALSPDGTQLAWAWADFDAPASGEMPAGVRVADLETGEVRTVRLTGRDGVMVTTIAWSPDSRWLVWQGRMQTDWDPDGGMRSGRKAGVAGRIPPGATRSLAVPMGDTASHSVSIASNGDVILTHSEGWQVVGAHPGEGGDRGVVRFDALEDQEAWLPADGTTGPVTPDGDGLAFRSDYPLPTVRFLTRGETLRRPVGVDSRAVVDRDLPADLYPEGALVEPVGWLDGDHVVARVTGVENLSESGWSSDGSDLVVMSAPWADVEVFEQVGMVDADYESTGEIQALSVAVDLMTLEEPTRGFPAPEWPWSDERKWGAAALIVVPLALLAFIVRQRRRNGQLA